LRQKKKNSEIFPRLNHLALALPDEHQYAHFGSDLLLDKLQVTDSLTGNKKTVVPTVEALERLDREKIGILCYV
jgi:hypothetical protein